MYVDPNKNRTNNWLASTKLKMPFHPTTYGPINKITYTDDFVNTKSMQNDENNSTSSQKRPGVSEKLDEYMGDFGTRLSDDVEEEILHGVQNDNVEEADSRGRLSLRGKGSNAEARNILQKMQDGRQVTADDARFLAESTAVEAVKNGDIVSVVKLIDALDSSGGDAVAAAKAVMNVAQGKGSDADYNVIRQNDGALTVLSAVEQMRSSAVQMRSAESGVRNDKNAKFERINLSQVSQKEATDIKRLTGADVSGYRHAINSTSLVHIENRHGQNGKHDNTMANLEDVARVEYVLENYDSVDILKDEKGETIYSKEFRGADNTPAPLFVYTKKINGTYYSAVAVAENSYKKLWVVSAYISKNKEGITQELHDELSSLSTTSETNLASLPSEEIIAQRNAIVKEGSAQWQVHNAYMRSAGQKLMKNPAAMQKMLGVAEEMRADVGDRAVSVAPTDYRNSPVPGNDEARNILQKMKDGRQVTADDARFLIESVAADAVKSGNLVEIVRVIDALDGRESDYIGSRESIVTAKSLKAAIEGKATRLDYELIGKSNGAVTVLSVAEEMRSDKNGNQKGYIIKDSESEAFRKKNPEGYRVAEKMAKDLRMPVKFVDGLRAEDGTLLDGVITSEGIFINTQSENPVRFALTHEFSHRMKKAAPKQWAKYQKYVIDRLKNTPTETEGVSEYDRRYELKKRHYAENEIDEEIACDFIGDGLINDVAEMRALINHDRSLAETIRKMWNYVCDFFGLSDEKDKATRLWIRAYDKSAKNVEKGKVEEFGNSPKFKIITMSDGSGRKYVHATQRVIKSKNPDMWESEIMDYVNLVVRKGEDVVIPLDNEESIVITGRTAWKLSGQR